MAAPPPTKLAQIRAATAAGDWKTALRIAAKFPQLGEHKEAISRGWGAAINPQFYREIGRDPHTTFVAGCRALAERYGIADPLPS